MTVRTRSTSLRLSTSLTFSTSITVLSLAISMQLYAQTDSTTDTQVDSADTTLEQKVSQDDNSSVKQLAPIVVTATRSAQSIAEIAGTVYSIDEADIQKQVNAGRSTADIVAYLVPSLTPSSGTTSNYGMTMRGRAVQYMIDGVPQTGSRDSSRQLNSISPNSIERIEVVSGASSIYGAGATGGIINIITKKGGGDALNFESKVGVTSGDNIRSDAMAYEAFQSVGFHQGDVSGYLGASYNKRGEFQDSHGDRIGPEVAQTDRQDTETVDINGRLSWQFTDNQKLSLGAQYYNDEQDSEYGADYGAGLTVLFGATPSLNAVKGLDLDTQPRTKRSNFNAQYEHQDLFGQTLNAEAYYRSETGRFYPSANGLSHAQIGSTYIVTQSETDIDVWGARVALQKGFDFADRHLNLTYGVDYDVEQGSQTAQQYDLGTFMASNGLTLVPTNQYGFGPDVDTSKLGFFLQSQFDLTDRLNLQAGVRHERIESEVQDSIPYTEAMVADMVPSYTPVGLAGGTIKHKATLFNLGAVYALTDAQQIFANFSQGANLPDVQRMMRDVPAGFVVSNESIDLIKVNNYELGWRIQADSGLSAGLTAFYNDSNKTIQFGPPTYAVDVIDTDERVYGAEANLKYAISDTWNIGGTLAYTRGQFKNDQNDWQELSAIRVSPLKGTAYSEWQFDDGYGLRVQALAVGGTDKAQQDAIEAGDARLPAEIKGFAVMDVIGNAKVGPGTLGFGVYNVWNRDYKSIYSQAVSTIYGAISSLPAQGRTYGLSYSVKY
ncbi:iron complex outermembrane recepter protein [Acinetobacter marinus]|uniref:Iron complex outermembrane recepter protein n=1 Tax=Acinetobacter marinus TaxID=281375 RepID=A0A1G6LZ09_9GAMM|nr:TonB-dependent receptor [Acinetobacter marinus]SDC47965.1 iron complex outermembrane recepter protein [Acinetobacter marinus]